MDREQFVAFVDARFGALVRSAYLMTGDHGHAEDVVQSALMKTLRAADRLPNTASAEAYTRTTMIRMIGRWGRRRWHGEVPTDDLTALDEHPSRALDPTVAVDVRRALAALSWTQRTVLVLRYFDDLTVEDTAAVLGCSAGTVKSRTSRALDALRRSGVLVAEPSETEHA